jgi:ubiquinone/menaquinone biosynthesis C-methylase UbiE
MSDNKTIEAYNKIAKDFHSRNSVTIYDKEYLLFKSLIGEGKKILEIGCGTGRDAKELINLNFDYTGVDASEGMIKIAREQVPNGNFDLGDFYNLDFQNETFDGFWAAASFLHVPKNDIDKVLSEAKRILKTNGVGFISLKQKTFLNESVIKEEKAGGIERFFAFWTKDSFSEVLKKNGFKLENFSKRQEKDKSKTIWLCFLVRKI